ncbi:DUF3519 domain-containing protein, partial [Helicobacter pylori]
MKENHNKENTMGLFQYLSYQRIKESDADLSFFDFIQKLEKLQKTHTIKSSVCNVKNRRVTYEQLKNSRQLINAYLRNVKDPSTLGYIQKASANFLKNDIDNAIENLLKQNKSAYEKISELQKSAISDYRDMKQALELVDKAKIRDKNTQESDAINSLMKIIKGQGQKDLTNYQALTKGLNESDKERLELSMLNRLMEQSLKQDESLKVFDSAQFFNQLNEFKDDVFTTPKAKEYID